MKTQDEYEDEFGKPEPVPAAKDIAADDDFEFAPKEEAKPVAAPETVAPAKAMSFKEAFKAARAKGNEPFEWNGKKFSTALASGKTSAKPTPKVAIGNESKHSVAAPAETPENKGIYRGTFVDSGPKVGAAVRKFVGEIGNSSTPNADKFVNVQPNGNAIVDVANQTGMGGKPKVVQAGQSTRRDS